MFYRILYLLAVLIIGTTQTQAKDVKAYIFGNSLVHHLSDSDETTVPHWLHVLAKSAGHGFAVDGQWGFLRNFSEDLPPKSAWSFKQVPRVWTPKQGDFAKAGFDLVMINSANFIQDRPADRATAWKNPTGRTPLQDSLVVLDWVAKADPRPVFYIYQGWQDMSEQFKKAQTNADLADYYDNAKTGYFKWYQHWAKAIAKARPDYEVRLIPVAKHLATLFTDTPLAEIPVADLYIDDAPHGTPTLYFLAAAITYTAFYDEPIPTDIPLPDSIHPLVRDNLDVINKVVLGVKHSAVQPAGDGLGLSNPALAMGLNGIADWSTENPFIDLMKTARPWVGHMPGKWGAKTAQELQEGGYLDAAGWPTKIPEGLSAIETFILTDQPKDSASIAGVYRLTYVGEGEVSVGGRASLLSAQKGKIRFRYQPGEGPVGIAILKTDPNGNGNYIRNIQIVHEDHIALHQMGALFNPDWIKLVQDLRVLRFMDWMHTNGSPVMGWEQRPKPDDYSYTRRGVPVEVMVKLVNQIGADPWFNMPHMADDDYVRNFATYVKENLAPDLYAYVEYSNELWNFTFGQAHWAAQQAEQRWGKDAAPDAWLQFAGMRAAEVAQIWSSAFDDQAEQRLVRVIATHTGWMGLEEGLLNAPLYLAENSSNIEPISWFDAYAVTGYFGLELGMDEMAPTVLEWIEDSHKQAEQAGKEQGLARVSLREYVKKHGDAAAIPKAIAALRQGSLDELLTVLLPYHAKIARQNGLKLVMYEGGTHVTGLADWSNNQRLTDFFHKLNYSPGMAEIYSELLQGWRAAGGSLFNAFVDVSAPSQYGSWGTWRYLGDENPRADVLAQFNQTTPAWWGKRAPDAFLHGGFYQGTAGGDEMRGTGKADIMLGGAGDDRFFAAGPGDLIHGGAGVDHVTFPGKAADYVIEAADGMIEVTGPGLSARLFAVEKMIFADEPERGRATSDY
ncbi:MAG: type I secretion protein [Rhodobacterales bacterium]|nr:MAG: type I secretion protein [Rhodobacterales bacterium]